MVMRLITTLLVCFAITGITACNQLPKDAENQKQLHVMENAVIVKDSIVARVLPNQFSRDSIAHQLKEKSKTNSLKIIHVLVPLCDNEHQGIVPVNASLGNGLNLRTNLYWGAGYGVKTHFTRSTSWVLQNSKLNPTVDVLERIVFTHSSNNVILVADAYRGDRMKACLQDYFSILAGLKSDTIVVNDTTLVIGHTTNLT